LNVSLVFKSLLADVAFRIRVPDRAIHRNAERGRFMVLMYHRVLPRSEIQPWIQPGMYVKKHSFERHIEYITRKFRPVHLSRLCLAPTLFFEDSSQKPLCAVTFDDGWHDFYLHAFPLLKRYEIPATVFLPIRHIDSSDWLWSDRIGRLLFHCHTSGKPLIPFGSIPNAERWLSLLGDLKGDFSDSLETLIGKLKAHRVEVIEELIDNLAGYHKYDPTPPVRAFIDWSEAQEMARSGIVEFGSHSYSHPILTTLPLEETKEELRRSRSELLDRGLANPETLSFCYPNGSFSKEIVAAVRDAEYKAAVTTLFGWNEKSDDPFMLKRLGMHEDVSSTPALFAARVAMLF